MVHQLCINAITIPHVNCPILHPVSVYWLTFYHKRAYILGTVRVTLVQTPLGPTGKTMVSQPSASTGAGSSAQQVYKPVTITTQQPNQATVGLGGSGGIRSSISATALVPTPLSVGRLFSICIIPRPK